MKTILKCLLWSAALLAVAVAMVYGFWLVLIFMLFDYTLYMWLVIAGEVAMSQFSSASSVGVASFA